MVNAINIAFTIASIKINIDTILSYTLELDQSNIEEKIA